MGEREKDRKKKHQFVVPLIHWLRLMWALTGDQTHNLGVPGGCSHQLSYAARAYIPNFWSMRRWLPQIANSKPGINPGQYSEIHYLKGCLLKLMKVVKILWQDQESPRRPIRWKEDLAGLPWSKLIVNKKERAGVGKDVSRWFRTWKTAHIQRMHLQCLPSALGAPLHERTQGQIQGVLQTIKYEAFKASLVMKWFDSSHSPGSTSPSSIYPNPKQ